MLRADIYLTPRPPLLGERGSAPAGSREVLPRVRPVVGFAQEAEGDQGGEQGLHLFRLGATETGRYLGSTDRLARLLYGIPYCMNLLG